MFDIKNRFNNEKIMTFELECDAHLPYITKLGLASIWAIQSDISLSDSYILDYRMSCTNIDGSELIDSNFSVSTLNPDKSHKAVGCDLSNINIEDNILTELNVIFSTDFNIDDISSERNKFVSEGKGSDIDYYLSHQKFHIIDDNKLVISKQSSKSWIDLFSIPLSKIQIGRIIKI